MRVFQAALFGAIFPILTASDSIPLSGIGQWTTIGPNPAVNGTTDYSEPTAGRITAIAPDPVDPGTIYAGAAGGGVWKSTDAGQTWAPLTDSQPVLFIGALAVAPSNPQVVYAGTGEANNGPSKELRERRFNIFSGRGVLRSADGGATWTLAGSDVFYRRSISRIVVDPGDAGTVYAAVGARASDGLDGNTGVWKSTDGGDSWINTTADISTTAPVSDLVLSPDGSLYAAFGDPLQNSVNGVYKSGDGGAHWSWAGDLPRNNARFGRISLALAPSAPSTLYAVIAQASADSNSLYRIYKTVNAGATWTALAISVNDKFCSEFGESLNVLASAGDYHNAVAVDPNNANFVYVAGLCLVQSRDGGASWRGFALGTTDGPHRDHHALAFDAAGRLLNGNDGGLWRLDGAAPSTWTNLNAGLQITQFQSIAPHPTDPDVAIGGTQDTGTMLFSDSLQWSRSVRGDGGVSLVDPTRPARVYEAIEDGNEIFARSLDGGRNFTLMRSIVPDVSTEARLWYFPLALDPQNGARLLLGTYRLWFSANAGTDWTAITAPNQSGWNASDPISAIAIAPGNPRIVYAAAGGRIFVTTDINTQPPRWTARQIPGLTDSIAALVAGAQDANTVYAVHDRFGGGHIYRSTDGGQTWSDLSGDLPDLPVYCLALDERNASRTLYIGTSAGVYASANDGQNWSPYGSGLPNSAVLSLVWQPASKVLTAATHGRGAWQVIAE